MTVKIFSELTYLMNNYRIVVIANLNDNFNDSNLHNLETIVKLNLYYSERISLSGLDQTLHETLNTLYFLVYLYIIFETGLQICI